MQLNPVPYRLVTLPRQPALKRSKRTHRPNVVEVGFKYRWTPFVIFSPSEQRNSETPTYKPTHPTLLHRSKNCRDRRKTLYINIQYTHLHTVFQMSRGCQGFWKFFKTLTIYLLAYFLLFSFYLCEIIVQ